MKTSHEAIAGNLKKLMEERRLTQTQLADKAGVSQKPYHLMIPDLPTEELTNNTIEKIIHYYAHSTKESRLNIARVAELESRYSVI